MSKYFNQEFKEFNCAQLLEEIKKLRNELAKRVQELKEDAQNLPKTGTFSIQGHLQQLNGKQTRLRKLLNEFNSRGCGGDTGDAWKYASADAPVALEEIAGQQGVDMKKLAKVGTVIGIGAAVLAAVLSAPAVGTAGVAACLIGFITRNNII